MTLEDNLKKIQIPYTNYGLAGTTRTTTGSNYPELVAIHKKQPHLSLSEASERLRRKYE